MQQQLEKDEVAETIQSRLESIQPYLGKNIQTEQGKLFEILADLTDEDGALAEMEDLESLHEWLLDWINRASPGTARNWRIFT